MRFPAEGEWRKTTFPFRQKGVEENAFSGRRRVTENAFSGVLRAKEKSFPA